MKVLACGGRDYTDAEFVNSYLSSLHHEGGPITMLIHGAARGADSLAAAWAISARIPTQAFRADWNAHGKGAGMIRNRRMLRVGQPDVVVAFPGGRGTEHMVRIAREAGIPILEARKGTR